MPPALTFNAILKRFPTQAPEKAALHPLTLSIEPGTIVGFLGPNGAGKTTALHLALGFLRPTAGTGTIFGRSFGDAAGRRQVGFLSDRPVFFPGNAESAVVMAATFSRTSVSRRAIQAILETVGLSEARGDVRKFSRGMQQRLALAQALVHQPKLLLLDEPISALDPQSTLDVLAVLRRLRDEGVAVLLSSHQLEAIATVADELVLLDKGRKLLSGHTSDLLRGQGGYLLTFNNLPVTTRLPASRLKRDGTVAVFTCPSEEQQAAIQQAWAEGATLTGLHGATESLTDLFLRMTTEGNAAEEGRP